MTEQTALLVGVFAHVDTLRLALRRLTEQDYRRVTVFSPVPLHDIDDVLGRSPSPVRYFTLGGGILGGATGFVLTIATSLHYPLITGGKPLVSLPPFLIIVFELAILFGALGAILGMLLNIRLPRLGPEPGYDPRFSDDRFGLRVRCPEDQRETVRTILQSCGAEEVRREEP